MRQAIPVMIAWFAGTLIGISAVKLTLAASQYGWSDPLYWIGLSLCVLAGFLTTSESQ